MQRCSRPNAIPLACVWLLLIASFWGCATSGTAPGATSKSAVGAVEGVEGTGSQPAREVRSGGPPVMAVPYYPPPAKMDLCGEPVPLHNQEVMERLDREFTVVVYNHAQVYLWLKRMERYFPWIEERLRSYGLPDDLKYVAVVESDLLANACSPKGAAGPWQFMPATGSAYGLAQTDGCDERYDFERATECAFRFLNDLYKRYRNWAIAIAAYNCGDKRIQEQMRYTRDYYAMRLPTETERYVLRILAVKAILGNPGLYGYNLPKGQGYPPIKADRVNVSLTCPLPMHAVAEATGTTVREIRRLNPALRREEIPRGTREIRVPEGQGKGLERNLGSVRGSAAPEQPSSIGDGSGDDGDEDIALQRPASEAQWKRPSPQAPAVAAPAAKQTVKKAGSRKAAASKSAAAKKKTAVDAAKQQENKGKKP